MTYEEIIDRIADRELDWECVHEIVGEGLEMLKRENRTAFEGIMARLEDYAFSIDEEEATQIVRDMSPKGEHWTMEEVRNFVNSKGIYDKIIWWYMVMNMCYNDYWHTAEIFGHGDDVNFFYEMAKDFINDPDAKPHKVEYYFLMA